MPQLPPWDQIEQRMRQAGESPESIMASFEEYQAMADPNPNITISPMENNDQRALNPSPAPVAYTDQFNRMGPTIKVMNPGIEESKKTLEGVAQARVLFNQLDVVKSAADRLIPAADVVKIGPVESGFMGSVRGLQRQVGNLPMIRTEEAGVRPWEQYSNGVLAILARGLGEKGVLTEQDVERVKGLLPRADDTTVSRETNFNELKTFVKSKIDLYEKNLRENTAYAPT